MPILEIHSWFCKLLSYAFHNAISGNSAGFDWHSSAAFRQISVTSLGTSTTTWSSSSSSDPLKRVAASNSSSTGIIVIGAADVVDEKGASNTRWGWCHTALVIMFSSSKGSTTVVNVPMVTLFFLTGNVAEAEEVEEGGEAVGGQLDGGGPPPFPLLWWCMRPLVLQQGV